MKNLTYLLFILPLLTFGQIELTDDKAEAALLKKNDRLILIDFYATWCGPCKTMEPIVKRVTEKYKDRVDIYKIDVDKNSVDDALGITSIPTYVFIKNESNLEQIEGAMSEAKLEKLIEKHLNASSNNTNETNPRFTSSDYTDSAIEAINNDWSKLNSLAWYAYENIDDIKILLKSIKIVKRSIELDQNYYNTDTHAALLYKTGRYNEALKEAKKAIDIAKNSNLDYSSTTSLIEKIIDDM